ncbi:H-2 class II histocompatibility antigen, A-U alpha chain-like [Platichthys flesus]|uniref:H-2 class II histocompatibility antigen, A-U alpha chain-like n=1 Tax=Platichthys flesus TaxID=8260 RepID=UPI002DB93E9F|nr:H-2 class II histocompatibility antigen, A-U alpha chain-like [Platichthys flesus]
MAFSLSALCSAVIILRLNNFCTCSQIAHEAVTVVGCFENGSTQIHEEFDGEEIVYIDFDRKEFVYTVPTFIVPDPTELIIDLLNPKIISRGRNACKVVLAFCIAGEKNPSEEKDPPESIIYPAEDVQLGAENSLICFVNNFFPPYIEVSWTKNDHPVSEGVSLSRYYPNSDQTFHMFSTLTFTPSEGDIYSCTVEHSALKRPKTRIWEADSSHQSHGADVFCGVGLTLGLLGVAAGTFLFVKGHHGY